MALAGNDEVGMLQEVVKTGEVKQQVGTGFHGSLQILQEGVSQPAGRSGTRPGGGVPPHTPGRQFGKVARAAVQLVYHVGRGALLRGKYVGGAFGAVERVAYVAGQDKPAAAQHVVYHFVNGTAGSQRVGQPPQHASSGIARAAAAQPDDKAAAAAACGVSHQFAYTVGGGRQRVALGGRYEGQSAGLGRFNDGRSVGRQSVAGRDGPHQRVVYLHFNGLPVQGGGKGLQHAFAAVGEGEAADVCAAGGEGAGKGGFHFFGGETAFEGIESKQYVHVWFHRACGLASMLQPGMVFMHKIRYLKYESQVCRLLW